MRRLNRERTCIIGNLNEYLFIIWLILYIKKIKEMKMYIVLCVCV